MIGQNKVKILKLIYRSSDVYKMSIIKGDAVSQRTSVPSK